MGFIVPSIKRVVLLRKPANEAVEHLIPTNPGLSIQVVEPALEFLVRLDRKTCKSMGAERVTFIQLRELGGRVPHQRLNQFDEHRQGALEHDLRDFFVGRSFSKDPYLERLTRNRNLSKQEDRVLNSCSNGVHSSHGDLHVNLTVWWFRTCPDYTIFSNINTIRHSDGSLVP